MTYGKLFNNISPLIAKAILSLQELQAYLYRRFNVIKLDNVIKLQRWSIESTVYYNA